VIAKLEESRTKFAASQMGSFCNDCSPPLYSATALPLKAETFRPLADMADVFFVQCVGYGAFRGGGSRYHHRGCRWLYKGWAKATSPREKNREQDREKNRARQGEKQGKTEGRNPAKQRKKIHRKTEKTQTKKPRKNQLNITVSSIPPANQRKEEPEQQAVTFIITGKKENRRSRRTQTRTKSPSYKLPRDLQKQVSHSHFLFILVLIVQMRNCAKVI
jgi:hypothetical protein